MSVDDIVALKKCGEHTWQEIGEYFGLPWTTVRARYLRRDVERPVSGCPLCGDINNRKEWKVRGNYAAASMSGDAPLSLEELMERLEVDTEVWRVVDWGSKMWQQGAKEKTGHLEWEGSKMDGYLDYEGLTKQDLWSTWAKFVRIEPVAIFPTIRPVQCDFSYQASTPPWEPAEEWASVLVLADTQFGFSRELRTAKLTSFHDRRALDIAISVAGMVQPDYIKILGDFFDLVNWTSRFLRSPRYEYTTQPAILEGHHFLRRLREAAPDAQIDMHEGNHDARLMKAILQHLKAAYGLRAADEMALPPAMSPQKLLALHELDIRWIGEYPDDVDWLTEDLFTYHGDIVRAGEGATGRAILSKYGVSAFYAHTHRSEMVKKTLPTKSGSRTIVAYCPGCLCRVGETPGSVNRMNWQQGIGVAYVREGRQPSITDIPIQDGVAIFDGVQVVGDDQVELLKEDLPDWNW